MECVGGHIAAICRWCRCKIDDLKKEKRDVFFSLIFHGFHNSASIQLQDPLGYVSSTLLCSDNPLPPLWRPRCRGPALCMQSPRRIFALDLTEYIKSARYDWRDQLSKGRGARRKKGEKEENEFRISLHLPPLILVIFYHFSALSFA